MNGYECVKYSRWRQVDKYDLSMLGVEGRGGWPAKLVYVVDV